MNSNMKQSGLPWAELIPSNWEVERGKRVLTLMQREVRKDDEIITCFRDGEVILRRLRREDGFTMSDKEIGYQGINVGDIVIHGMDGFAGAIGVSKSQGKGTPVYVVCTTKDNSNNSYVVYYLRTLAQNNVFLALATGIRERSCDLKWNKISVLPFILPPISEQKAIADFLDKKCEEIDELVALQEKIIEELKSYKQSIITETVCKGLNPNAPMKDSGVDWIGEIPEGWQSVPFRAIYNLTKGLNITKENLVENGVPVISYGQIHSKENSGTCIKESLLRYVPETYLIESPTCLVKKGDIIFADTSEDLEGCGNGVYIDKHMQLFAGYHTIIAQAQDIRGITKYLSYLFLTGAWRLQIRSMVNGVKLYSIPQKLLKRTTIILPPIAEQEEIADYLDKKCSEIDQLISIKQQKIVELKDYKKSLIYEYTTGKKRVEA